MKPFNPEDLAYRPEGEKKRRLSLKYIVVGVIAIILVIGVAFWRKGFLQSKPTPQSPEAVAQREYEAAQKKTKEILAVVDKQINLPTDEEPIFATVSDRNQLQNQDFFKDAQNGDKILMYPKNKKAYLYRPSTKQVLATAPLEYQGGKGDTNASPSAQAE